jgi:ABC-type uncharacterized transport system involved in gliding motility auxiliary subunit
VNYLFYKNDKNFDLTTKGYHSLSDQTKKILVSLNSPLKMTLFAKRGDWDYYLSNIEKYDFASKNITLQAIDIDSDISKVRFHNITENGTLLLEYKGRKVTFKIKSELNITNNILKVLRDKAVKVYFSTGHGELDFQSKKKLGADILGKAISSSNYKLIPLDLLRENIPKDIDALLIAAPRYGFLDSEVDKLESFLNRGGNLVILLQANLLKTNFKNLYDLFRKNGVMVRESIVIDRLAKTLGSEFTTPVVSEFSKNHRITKDFSGRVLFPLSLAFEKVKPLEQIVTFEKLAWTAASPATWAETDIEGVIAGKSALDDKDIKGPITLAATVSNKKNQSRIVLFGSGAFVSNAFESQSNNFNLFLNSLSWILDDEGIISINRPGLKNSKVLISLSQETLILFFILICIPGSFFLLGFYFYRRALNQ